VTKKTNIGLTAIMSFTQVVIQVSSLDNDYKHIAFAAQILFEALKALRAHDWNPDGTRAEVAYLPPD